MRLEVFPTADMAAAAAADTIAGAVREAAGARGRCCLAVSGGTSPRRMFEELAKADLPWTAIDLFQVDERLAREGSPDRNFTGLKEDLLAHVDLPAVNLHPMPVGMPGLDDAARRYEEQLRTICGDPPRLDVVHLGLGLDGHTASLFDGDPAFGAVEREVAPTGEHHGLRRLTLTLPPLNRAGLVVWLVTGSEKAKILETLTGGGDIPAAHVRPERAVLFADEAAGGRLRA